MSHMFFFRVKHLRISEKMWFDGSQTAVVADVSEVFSAHEERTIWNLVRFAKEKGYCNFANW